MDNGFGSNPETMPEMQRQQAEADTRTLLEAEKIKADKVRLKAAIAVSKQ